MQQSFNWYIENAIKENWESIALSDFKGVSYSYKDIARKIAKMHILLEAADIKHGDKVAICGRNSSHWAVAFFATLTYKKIKICILPLAIGPFQHPTGTHYHPKSPAVADRLP